jgi:hypothetical protein
MLDHEGLSLSSLGYKDERSAMQCGAFLQPVYPCSIAAYRDGCLGAARPHVL